jgi:hypothetical protein
VATKTKRNNGARNEQQGEVLELIAEAQRLAALRLRQKERLISARSSAQRGDGSNLDPKSSPTVTVALRR